MASHSLQFIIVGGGIAGLASAFTLQRAGHQVIVLEKAPGPAKGGGGIRSPPNMHRILLRWGLGPQLAQYAIKGSEMSLRLVETGEKIGAMVFHDEIMKGFGADWLFIQHGDLHGLLTTLASDAGATIRYDSDVVSIDPEVVSVTLLSGETVTSDLILVADGLLSVFRASIVEDVATDSKDEGHLHMWNSSIPGYLIHADESLQDLLQDAWHMWMGDGWTINAHAMHTHESYSLAINAPLRHPSRYNNLISELPEYDYGRDTLEPRLQTLMALASSGTLDPCLRRQPLQNLVHDNGKVILIGAAAHLVSSGLTQNTAMGIEDAATLGSLFSRLHSAEQVPSLVSAFEDIRLPRLEAVLASEIEKVGALTIPAGTELEAGRNSNLRSALSQSALNWDEVDEGLLREQWEDYIRMFDYDAEEVAEEWWIHWGRLMVMGQPVRHEDG